MQNSETLDKDKLAECIENNLKYFSHTEENFDALLKTLTEKFSYEYLSAMCEVQFRQKKLIFIRHAQSTYNQWKNSSVFHLPFLYENVQ